MTAPTKWGILSAGNISSDFVTCLHSSPNHKAVAVAARSLDHAKKFAEKFGIGKAYGSYDELYKDPEVEIVYVGTVQAAHFKCGKMALEHGKHVLLEKAFTLTTRGAERLIQLARSKNLFLMEAVWARFNPIYKLVIEKIKEGEIGKVYHVNADFGLPSLHYDRMVQKTTGGGCMLDLGVYPLNIISMVYDNEEPVDFKATGHLNKQGVDESVAMSLKYSDGRIATGGCHLAIKMANECNIVGTKGKIRIPEPFWCPTKVVINEQTYEVPLPDIKGKFCYTNSHFLIYEADHVRECLQKRLTESPILPHKDTITLRKTSDHILRQMGVIFEE